MTNRLNRLPPPLLMWVQDLSLQGALTLEWPPLLPFSKRSKHLQSDRMHMGGRCSKHWNDLDREALEGLRRRRKRSHSLHWKRSRHQGQVRSNR